MAKFTSKAADAFEKAFVAKRIFLVQKKLEELKHNCIDYTSLTKEEQEYKDEHAKYLLSLPSGVESKGI